MSKDKAYIGDEIVEGNKLIAEFCGFKIVNCEKNPEWKTWGVSERSYPIASADGKTSMILVDDSWIVVNTLEFHTSFDWLKYAVDKFLSTPSEIFNYNAVAMTQLRQCKSALSGLSIASTHGNIYNTLLSGIKWYNQNKQS